MLAETIYGVPVFHVLPGAELPFLESPHVALPNLRLTRLQVPEGQRGWEL